MIPVAERRLNLEFVGLLGLEARTRNLTRHRTRGSMAKKIGIAVAVLIVAFLGFAATRPATFQLERSASMKAPPEKIAALVNDFHNWGQWSPWEKLDPGMKKTYSGAPTGKDAVYEWDGNDKVGAGRMQILDASPSKITVKLDFLRPFEGHNITEFTFEPKGGTTDVTWEMHGPNSFMGKVMHIFIDMDSMVGKDFEGGLGAMKAAAEK
jgi:Polyketide cyclase / dehydrase and lipid transport